MFEFKVNPLTSHITQITDPTGVFCFLVTGEKEAVLIDTGVGISGLKNVVAELTKLPLTVVLTHGHGDHAGGAAEFARIYLHPADLPMIREHGMEMRMDYAAGNMPPETKMTETDFVPEPAEDKEFLELLDGQVFDLGGVSLEIIHVPGHTPGSCCILIPEERVILFGDACNINTLILWGVTIGQYRKELERLKTFESRYDKVLYSHGPQPEGPTALDDNIELCDRILSGTDDKVPCNFRGMPVYRAAAIGKHFRRLDGKYGNIVYSDETGMQT